MGDKVQEFSPKTADCSSPIFENSLTFVHDKKKRASRTYIPAKILVAYCQLEFSSDEQTAHLGSVACIVCWMCL